MFSICFVFYFPLVAILLFWVCTIALPFWLRVYSAMPQKKVRVPTSGAFLNLGFSLRKFLYILYTSTGIFLVSGSAVMFLHGV